MTEVLQYIASSVSYNVYILYISQGWWLRSPYQVTGNIRFYIPVWLKTVSYWICMCLPSPPPYLWCTASAQAWILVAGAYRPCSKESNLSLDSWNPSKAVSMLQPIVEFFAEQLKRLDRAEWTAYIAEEMPERRLPAVAYYPRCPWMFHKWHKIGLGSPWPECPLLQGSIRAAVMSVLTPFSYFCLKWYFWLTLA